MTSSNPIRYFVTNFNLGKIFVFDEQWNYVSEKLSFTRVAYMILVGNHFYITGDSVVWKTDEQLNKLIQYNSTGSSPLYRGLYYSSSNNLIYVAPYNLQVIHVFNLDLRLTDTISSSPYSPWAINGYNNQLYVGARDNGKMLVIVNKQIIKQFDGCNGQNTWLTSILFDEFDKMATACANDQLYLYDISGNYLNKIIPAADIPRYIAFDSKSRLVVVAYSRISIYN